MVNSRNWKQIIAVVTACIIGMTGCQNSTINLEEQASLENADSASSKETEEVDSWKKENYQKIVFEGDSISTSADGVFVDGTTVTITSGGTYVLSGVLQNGRIVVDATKEDEVTLVWNGVEISCADAAPVYIIQADKTIFYLADQTENFITDGERYLFLDGETEPDAAVFAKDDLTIKGTGSLTVNANYYDGIVCKNDLKITGGKLTVYAVHHGIKGKDSLTVKGGTIFVDAGEDGMKSSNEALVEEDGKKVGWVQIEDGTITIAAKDDAIHAESDLTINGGIITITESYEGLEGACIYLNGGEISLYASDDGVNASGYSITNTVNEKENFFENIPPDRIEMGEEEGERKEKLEKKGEAYGTRKAMGTMSSGGYLEINGGTIYVNADGDGIDVNGSIVMNGGIVQVDGTESGGDGTLDYDTTFEINGGVLIGVGNQAMAQTTTSGSAQNSMAVYFDTMQKAGSIVSVLDSSGKELLSYTSKKQYNFFLFSSEKLELEHTYMVLVDEVEQQSLVLSEVVTTSGNVSKMQGFGGRNHGRVPEGEEIPKELPDSEMERSDKWNEPSEIEKPEEEKEENY